MIINKLKVLEEHWERVANNTRPAKGGMDGGMEEKNREDGKSLC